MFLKQIRTYIMLLVVVCVYGYFLYVPFRSETMNDIILDYSRAIESLHVNDPSYGTELNDVLNQNLKLRGYFYNKFRDSRALANQTEYWQAESMTHKIQLQLLVMLLNHDLYTQTGGTAAEQPDSSDYQRIQSMISSLSSRNLSKADDLQKTAYNLMKQKGENFGGVYILAHDMFLLTQMNDPFNQLLWQIDYNILRGKLQDLTFKQPEQTVEMSGKIHSSFINNVVDDAVSSIQMGTNVQAAGNTEAMLEIARSSYTCPALPVEQGPAFVKMTGIDNNVVFRKLVTNTFSWDVPNGKYNVEVHQDGDFDWHQSLDISTNNGFVANLVRSDQATLTVFKPSIMESIQQIGYNLLDFIKQSDEPQAGLTYMSFEQMVEKIPTGQTTQAAVDFKKEIQPQNILDELRQLNEQFYNIVNGYGSSSKQRTQMIADVFPQAQIPLVESIWKATKLTGIVKLDYILIDIKAFRETPQPAAYVTFAWFTPGMEKEGWNVYFQMVNGRWVIVGANKNVDPALMSKFGTMYSYTKQNHLEYLQSIQPVNQLQDMLRSFQDLLPVDLKTPGNEPSVDQQDMNNH